MGLPKKTHVLLITITAPGHFRLFQQFLHNFALSKDIIVTFASGLDVISAMNYSGDFGNLELRLVEVFGDVPSYPDPRFPARLQPCVDVLEKQFEPFKEKLISEKTAVGSPTCLIADMYLPWTQEIAQELEIPWFVLCSTSVGYYLSCLAAPTLIASGRHPERKDEHLGIPGLSFCYYGDLVNHDMFDFPDIYLGLSQRLVKASGILLNSAEELEASHGILDAFRTRLKSLTPPGQKVTSIFPVGPIVSSPGFSVSQNFGEDMSDSRCLEWLDSQSACSVLFISSGTMINRSEASLKEVAFALESTGVAFLWVITLAPGDSLSNVFSEEFLLKTKSRGFIETGWAPQAQALMHPSISAFLTHCGWNSCLEGMCAGLPMLVWPYAMDQPMSARFLVDVAKVGVEIGAQAYDYEMKVNPNAASVSREAVERGIRMVMMVEKGKELRRNAQQLKKQLKAAITEGGSSHRNLKDFMNLILDTSVQSSYPA